MNALFLNKARIVLRGYPRLRAMARFGYDCARLPDQALLLDLMPWNSISLGRRFRFIFVRLLIGALFARGEPRRCRIANIRWSPSVTIRLINFQPFLTRLRESNLWENEIRAILTVVSSRCRSFVDIGSNDGFYAIVFAKTSTVAPVVAVEPWSNARRILYIHLLLNGLVENDHSRVQVLDAFVGCKPAAMSSCNTVSMSEILKNLESPILVKMDIDGGEVDALQSGFPLKTGQIIYFVIETHSLQLEEASIQLLKENGFQTQIIYNASWRAVLPEERPILHNRWLLAWNSPDNLTF